MLSWMIPTLATLKKSLKNIAHDMNVHERNEVFNFDDSCDPIEWTLIDEGK